MNITLKYLRYFVITAKHCNFSKASEELYISTSSVIAAITNLEQEFGFDLFVRQASKGLILTKAGQRALSHAKFILDEVKSFDEEMNGIATNLTGTLSIGCFETFAPYFMADIISELRTLHPELSIDVREGDIERVQKNLLQGDVDGIIAYNIPTPPPEIRYEVLKSFPAYALMPTNHPLAKQTSVSLRELSEYPMVLFDLPASGQFFKAYFVERGLQANVVLRAHSVEMVRGYVGEGLGFSILHIKHPSNTTYNGKKLVYTPIRDEVLQPKIITGYLSRSGGKAIRKVEAFMSVCRDFFQSDKVDKFFIATLANQEPGTKRKP